ncbi:Oxidoreductase [Pleurostoma richardsiae]|uniref:Oxidoreductase n=1 Tax=Pleurostoma richardsiae TaxID=41990 RepID=A0AA38VL55_9PEZI|nr:Oxidoreductase [Pleurostoma richardsiae]
MHILGLCNGSIHGNSEILLKAALKAAVEFDSSTTVSWIHVPSVALPRNHKPLKVNASIIPGRDDEAAIGAKNTGLDDRAVVFNAIMDADALIIASPIYSHQPAGTLKALADAILGPYADVSEAYRSRRRQESGEPGSENFQFDPRETKPRVAGFIAVAGSSAPFPEQWTMALPSMHIVTYPIHARVVDQVVFPGFATAGAVLLDAENTVERAKRLGVHVASQMGKPYDEARYLGPKEEGSCPYCYLLKIEFREENHVVCTVCGANGTLVVGPDGNIRPTWEDDSNVSCMTLKGKWKHLDDIVAGLGSERSKLESIQEGHSHWKRTQIPFVDLPSMHADITASLEGLEVKD